MLSPSLGTGQGVDLTEHPFNPQLQTLATDRSKINKIHDKLYIGLTGLASDQSTFFEKLKFRIAMYNLREERDIKPASFGKLVSTLLYEKRFGPYFIEVSPLACPICTRAANAGITIRKVVF